jgi:hypothetical protein
MASETGEELFEAFINDYDDASWREVINRLLPRIHEVDRNATRIWFHMYPLALLRALERTEDRAGLVLKLQLNGRYFLKDAIDSSHWFLYGHCYWAARSRPILRC